MEIKRKSVREHNSRLSRVKRKPKGMIGSVWNTHLDKLKSEGKYKGEIYAKTRTRVDELWEIEEELR